MSCERYARGSFRPTIATTIDPAVTGVDTQSVSPKRRIAARSRAYDGRVILRVDMRSTAPSPVVGSIGCLAILAMLALLTFIAPRGEWIGLPFGAVRRADDLRWMIAGHGEVPTTQLFRVLMLAGILTAPLHRTTSVVCASACVTFLALVFLRVAFFEPEWLMAYLHESQERVAFAGYVAEHFVQNRSIEPTFTPIREFETLADQSAVAWAMLGWGYQLACGCACGLLALLWSTAPDRRWMLMSIALVGVLLLLGASGPVLGLVHADRARRDADRHLVQGRGAEALAAYERSLQGNPTLASSRPFLRKAALANDALRGERGPWSAVTSSVLVSGQSLERRSGVALERARRRLLAQHVEQRSRPLTSPLDRSIAAMADAAESELWIAQGMYHAKRGELGQALAAHLHATPRPGSLGPFYLAHLYLELNRAEPALFVIPHLQAYVTHPVLSADLFSTLGDALTLQGRLVEARAAYARSRKLDGSDNYRAVRALSGG